MPDVQPQTLSAATPGDAPDPLAKLYHMSTTAGAGTQEYVAINPVAVAALILGLASVLAFLSSVLLVIPAAGIVCGIIAIVQIRNSNQTQTGLPLAVLGLLLCVGFGGGRGAYTVVRRLHVSDDEKQIAKLMHQLGQDIAAEKYEEAYALFNDRFHEKVNRGTFENAFRGYRSLPTSGPVQSIEWNNEPMTMEEQPGNDVTIASAMAFFKFEKDPAPRRSVIVFEKSGGVWHIHDIDAIFRKGPPQ